MKLTKCPSGHFYDASQYSACPHCENTMNNAPMAGFDSGMDDSPTVAMDPNPSMGFSGMPTVGGNPTEPLYDDSGKTVAFYPDMFNEKPVDPVVGFLICVKGENFGQAFNLKEGRNFIGRDSDMDVILGDSTVSRNKHAIVVYEPKQKMFLATPGDSRSLFYVNDDVVLAMTKLKAYDRLSIGNSELLFLPFCGENFCWEDTKEK